VVSTADVLELKLSEEYINIMYISVMSLYFNTFQHMPVTLSCTVIVLRYVVPVNSASAIVLKVDNSY